MPSQSEVSTIVTTAARTAFRVLTQIRGGYGDGVLYDVQLQSRQSGNLLWALTFTDADEAQAFEAQMRDDLDELDEPAFRRKHGVPATA